MLQALAQRTTGALNVADQVTGLAPSCACGGCCPRRQPKSTLEIGTDANAYEREATTVADQVTRAADPTSLTTPVAAGPRRKRTAGSATTALAPVMRLAPAGVHATLANAGRALDAPARRFFEPRLGLDLGAVRIHDDQSAATSAHLVAARAYTVGSDIVFGAGEYRPTTAEGRTLLAHELVHVRQAALGGRSGVLRRTPCPSCHKPTGTQRVALEELHDDDVHYLPDEEASEFFTYMRAGLVLGEYLGGKRSQVRSVRYYNYDGRSEIVGYVLYFTNPKGSNFPSPVLKIDVYGNQLEQTWIDPEPVESVASPVDFIGPAFLTRPFIGGVRAFAGNVARAAPRFGAAAASTARNLAFATRIRTPQLLGSALEGAGQFPALTLSASPSSFVLRAGGELTAGARAATAATDIVRSASAFGQAAAARATTPFTAGARTASAATDAVKGVSAFGQAATRASGPSFSDVSSYIGAETAGTITYSSTAAAASAARTAGLVNASTPGFQSHSTAAGVRQALNLAGHQSAHLVPQAVYRALRSAGVPVSAGRALTTNLPTEAHAALDRTWVREWNSALASGRTIRVVDLYRWISRAIDTVDDRLINAEVRGAIQFRLESELFRELGLAPNDVLVPGRP
jgi:hypothetical protein